MEGKSIPDQLRESAARRKRKPEEELISEVTKTARSSKIAIAFPNGGIRITRTPGRENSKNCICLDDLILKQYLVSAFVFSFFIADEEFFPYLPLSHSSNDVPIYIGRDANMDSTVQAACAQAGININGKITKKQLQDLAPRLKQINYKQYGKNFHSFYAWSSGSSHSKILALVYPDFLRIVITSCNLMKIDTELGDNHWYIHDLPQHSTKQKGDGFEADFLAHLQALGTPDTFLDSIRGRYDYSTVKVDLITSVPGTHDGLKAEKHGLLRLRRVVQDLGLSLPDKESEGNLKLEVCTASLGNLSAKWLDGFHDCALGKESVSATRNTYNVPEMKIFYPTVSNVKSAHQSSQDAASNIGCHIRPWDQAPKEIKSLFRHYESKDEGRLFHQKFVLVYNTSPYYIYFGSANLSPSAWGSLEQTKKTNEVTCDTKLAVSR